MSIDDKTEDDDVNKKLPSKAAAVHELIRADGEKELKRHSSALFWSGMAAGISMSLSMVTRGLLHTHVPHTDLGFLIEAFGYSAGFLVVIMARQQLFTENTVKAVLPVMYKPSASRYLHLFRLWGVVFVANMLGTALAALTFVYLPIFNAETHDAFIMIGREVLLANPFEMFSRAIVSGWLIATMVWLIPSAGDAKIWVILFMTYIISIGSFPHIVAGATDVFYLVFAGSGTWSEAILQFVLPTLAGNIVGGTFIFALISHAQIRSDLIHGANQHKAVQNSDEVGRKI